MGDGHDHLLWNVVGLMVACVALFGAFLVATPGVELVAVFGGGPMGVALAVVAVVLGVAGYVALEATANEAFSD